MRARRTVIRSFQASFLVVGVILSALLTGCSGGGNVAGPQVGSALQQSTLGRILLPGMPAHGTRVAAHPFLNFAAMAKNKGDTIAISDIENNAVDLFTADGMQVGQLTGFDLPQGMASDSKGDLYIADAFNSRVQVYAAGFAKPPTTLSESGQSPADVDSFSNGAYVAVTNFQTAVGGAGSVSIFKGSKLQSNITSPTLAYVFFCAFDASGNLYVDGHDATNNFVVGEIRNATSGGTKFEQLTTANAIAYPSGIQVTTSGQIAIEDLVNLAIYTYNPPSRGSLGTPAHITPLGGSGGPVTFAFTKNMADLYTADDSAYELFEYAYPAGGAPVSTITVSGVPYGTAVIPTQYPENSRK
jgi:hypothetical protein